MKQEVGSHIRDFRVRLSALGTFVSKMGLPLVRLGIRLCFDGVRLRLRLWLGLGLGLAFSGCKVWGWGWI